MTRPITPRQRGTTLAAARSGGTDNSGTHTVTADAGAIRVSITVAG